MQQIYDESPGEDDGAAGKMSCFKTLRVNDTGGFSSFLRLFFNGTTAPSGGQICKSLYKKRFWFV